MDYPRRSECISFLPLSLIVWVIILPRKSAKLNVAGIGSLALCPGQIAVGINVSGTHVQAVSEGDTVTAFAKIVHKGRTLHTWQVDIKNTAGEVICTVQVINYVFTPKKDNQKKGAETKV